MFKIVLARIGYMPDFLTQKHSKRHGFYLVSMHSTYKLPAPSVPFSICSTVESVITHSPQWTLRTMGYDSLWACINSNKL